MHDLNTINRLNYEAFAEGINKHRTAGRHVLAKYAGLHLVSIETFSDQPSAQAAFDAEVEKRSGSERTVLFAPITPYVVEDGRLRSNAPADLTIGDYINRKTT